MKKIIKTKYLLKPKGKSYDLYMYDKELLVKYICESGEEKSYKKKVELKYTSFSKFIKRGQNFLFKDEGFMVELFDLEEKKEVEREVLIRLVEDKGYMLSLWCLKDKENYLDGLTVEEKDFEYFVCADPGGKVQIKINAEGFYFQADYMRLEKEIKVNGKYDIDIMPMGGGNKFIKGALIK